LVGLFAEQFFQAVEHARLPKRKSPPLGGLFVHLAVVIFAWLIGV
jgi:hypothetical protein